MLELIVLLVGAYFFIKYFYKVKSSSDNSITPDVIRDGVKSALREINYEEQDDKLNKSRMEPPNYVYSTATHNDEFIKESGGDLIPFGLTDKERETLRMFYSKDD